MQNIGWVSALPLLESFYVSLIDHVHDYAHVVVATDLSPSTCEVLYESFDFVQPF